MTITVDNLRRRVPAGELLASGMGRGLIRVRVSISNVRCAHPQQPGGSRGEGFGSSAPIGVTWLGARAVGRGDAKEAMGASKDLRGRSQEWSRLVGGQDSNLR
jgi:hypothetical protein